MSKIIHTCDSKATGNVLWNVCRMQDSNEVSETLTTINFSSRDPGQRCCRKTTLVIKEDFHKVLGDVPKEV